MEVGGSQHKWLHFVCWLKGILAASYVGEILGGGILETVRVSESLLEATLPHPVDQL